MTTILDPHSAAPDAAQAAGAKLTRGAVAWSLFEGARNPFVILITIYVFMPYFSNVVIGDPVEGQKAVATYGQWSGLIVALTAPILGASIDRLGPRKPWLLLVTALMLPLIWALWFTKADHTGLSIAAVIVLATLINTLFSYTEVLHNSMLMRAAGAGAAHKASGLALSLGNGVSVAILLFVLWGLVLPGATPWSFVPKTPLFGLSQALHEPDRIVGPIVAVLFALGAIPLFLFTPDAPKTGVPMLTAYREGARSIWGMLKSLKGHRDAAIFLGARMLYIDSMTAVLLFAGVYAGGVMHWQTLQLLAYGVLLSTVAVFGGFLGGAMDSWFGPKTALRIEIAMTVLGLVGFLGMAPDRILFLWPYDPAAHAPIWHGPMFTTLPEVIFVLIGFSNALFITGSYASGRTLLTRLTPPEQTGAFFGVFALSGTATVWVGSSLVLWATGHWGTQQAGFIALAILMFLGFLGLLFVRGGTRA